MAKFRFRNIVPGHWRGVKRKGHPVKFEQNPGYDVSDSTRVGLERYMDLTVPYGEKPVYAPDWYKPVQRIVGKRKDKRGQSRPR